ncbi:MAG: SDR family oxidoreductase [Acidobacteria bacterium]|nr:SDR family oxidoreductase [Acidobacteriota bacterium]
MKLKNQIALITGGGRGIGRAIAERFAREGAAVMLTSRTEAELRAAVAAIEKAGGNAGYLAGDLREEAFIPRLVGETREHWGEIDILGINAGIYGPMKPVTELSSAEWDDVMSVNLRAPFLLTRAVLPGMVRRRRGVVLNISTISAKLAFPLGAAYAAAKAGLLGLTRVAAAEVGRYGVRVNALCPGPVQGTQMWEEVGAGLQKAYNLTEAQLAEETNAAILQGRPQQPEEVAAAALFLCSDDSSAITGQAVNVDGGEAFY